jgi:hypothetical protein
MMLWRVAFFLFCFGAVITQPVFTARYYQWMLEHGAYRWDADSIAIPIGGNFVAWFAWAPVFTTLFLFAFWKLEKVPRLLAWDSAKRVKSIVASVVCFGCVYLVGQGIADAAAWRNWEEIAYCVWWIIVWLLVRAALLIPKKPNQTPEPTSPSVTDRAGARSAPAGAVAHL